MEEGDLERRLAMNNTKNNLKKNETIPLIHYGKVQQMIGSDEAVSLTHVY